MVLMNYVKCVYDRGKGTWQVNLLQTEELLENSRVSLRCLQSGQQQLASDHLSHRPIPCYTCYYGGP